MINKSISFEKAIYAYKCYYQDKYNMSDVEYPDIVSSYNDSKGGWFLRGYRQTKLAHVNKAGYVKLNY
tara:strand:+ start:1128 stop:1331 length:204 start_codon:yes stop_codon:yes gene_type:complete